MNESPIPAEKIANKSLIFCELIANLQNICKKFYIKKFGGYFLFWGGWGCPTPQENSLKPPQDQ